ncbi:hypothetical protein GCK72_017310 [Caenorhabditis remanei]|uniref:mannose-6-phosphate isomerase n=1 Tax=Caenorhabditis remanei TaxID=31234 RepID=A0A6A5G8D4_CAERE|nr:hypothetical protein GCK72_017310 [Caenorhabditis remanei]KAF1750759.1 hypothetical protein GCK72_017310 [Caenorhabditis remanei]
MEQLQCHVKQYAWGKYGEESEVARLFADGHDGFQIDNKKPYAELWMGTHPDGPAQLKKCSTRLSTYLAKHPSPLTNNNSAKNIHLPFIMKVMSIRTTLSLQVHPTKEQARELHENDPVNYPDRNHKPELAYALTRFELLCGFRPAREILKNLQTFPSFRLLFGGDTYTKPLEYCIMQMKNLDSVNQDSPEYNYSREYLEKCFRFMMTIDTTIVHELVSQLLKELDNGLRGAVEEVTVGVIRKMSIDFPNDIGIFSPLFLNHMILEPGQCCYYAAGELHAYLSGECVECVGCSNNTIRAAMTPKYIDRDALCKTLNYKMTEQSDYLVPEMKLTECVDMYAPDCKDFQLHRIRVGVDQSEEEMMLPTLDCASILVVTSGKGTIEEATTKNQLIGQYEVKRGDIFYIPPNHNIRFLSCSEPLEGYRTFSYEMGPDHDTRVVTPVSATVSTNVSTLNEKMLKLDADMEEAVV